MSSANAKPEIRCCGSWIPYPVRGRTSVCPDCETVFVLKGEPKHTDVRDAEQAMAPVLAGIEQRREQDKLDAIAGQDYLDNDPMAYALGHLLAGIPNLTVLNLETGEPFPVPPRELPPDQEGGNR